MKSFQVRFFSTLSEILIVFRFGKFARIYQFSRLHNTLTTSILLQLEKISFPIVVVFSGMVMLVRLSHPSNALSPIVVTFSGMVMFVRLLQPENA